MGTEVTRIMIICTVKKMAYTVNKARDVTNLLQQNRWFNFG